MAVGPSADVPEPVRVGCLKARVGEDRVAELRLAREIRVRLGGIDDDAGDRASALPERFDVQLQTLQLRDAEGSPVAAIEDEEQRRAAEVFEPDGPPALVDEGEGRGWYAEQRS